MEVHSLWGFKEVGATARNSVRSYGRFVLVRKDCLFRQGVTALLLDTAPDSNASVAQLPSGQAQEHVLQAAGSVHESQVVRALQFR